MSQADVLVPAVEKVPVAPVGTYIKGLAYLGFEVSDLDAWKGFAADVVGFQVRPGIDADELRFKLDDRSYRFIARKGPSDDIVFAGWEVADVEALEDYARYLTGRGIAFEWATPAELQSRGVRRMLRLRDPNDLDHEIFADQAVDDAFVPTATRGEFVTGSTGLGHIVFGTGRFDDSIAFVREVLGGAVSDDIEQAIAPGVTAFITFMHVNDRHHSIAFARRKGVKKLHHFMVEVANIVDVGLARDRHLTSGLAIAQDIGQHPNDQMVSYYGATPSGFLVEFGWGGVKVDVETWKPGFFDRMSDWGHRPVGSPARPRADTPPNQSKEPYMPTPQNWTLTVVTPMGPQKSDLVLDETLSGTLTAMGVAETVHDAAMDGEALTFKAKVTRPFPMTLEFDLSVSGDTVSGEVQAGAFGKQPVTGTRA